MSQNVIYPLISTTLVEKYEPFIIIYRLGTPALRCVMGQLSIFMKFLTVVWVSLTLFFVDVNADVYQSVRQDINNGLLPVEAAERAHDNDELSIDVVSQMIDADVDVVKAVQTVAKEWSSCDDTYAAVRKGVQFAPERADEIVASVATMRGCHCNPQSFWARSRLEQRLRPRINRSLVEITSSCSCASAGIEAAIEIVPDKTEEMIDAVIVAKNRAQKTADAIGQVGHVPDQKFWGANQILTKDTILVRNTDVCKGDHNETDEFDPQQTWKNQDMNINSSVFDFNKALGQHKLLCEEEDQDKTLEEQEEEEDKRLIISQYVEGYGSNQALELYNGSDKAIDLLMDNYQIEVYFHGYDFPGEVIQLRGKVEPQSTFVVADANAAADIRAVANQKVNGLIFKGADAVVLKTGFDNGPCECAVSTVASAINGIDKDSEENEVSQKKKDFIQRIEEHYENTNIQSTVVDSIGQIVLDEDSQGNSADQPIATDQTLRRLESICKGDRIEMDEFIINKEWQSYAIDNFLDSGNFDKQDCLASRKDLLLSEYIEGTDDNAMIELFNGTDRPIDFDNEKYFLEIFTDNDKDPEKRIYLKGQVDRNDVFVISHDDAESDLKKIADQTTSELDLAQARAVVLKKVVLPAYQSCYVDIANWLTQYDGQVTYTLTPIYDPGSGPVTDDDPRDGDDGGELASPN